MRKWLFKRAALSLAVCLALSLASVALPVSSAEGSAKASIVVDVVTLRVLEETNARTRLPMASTTKIMTALVAIELGDLESMVTVSKNAAGVSGSTLNLKVGDQIMLGELIVATMFVSGNDGAVAIAEHVSGSVDAFVREMNAKAAELGCTQTNFKNPHGLPNPDHYTTAYELAVISSYALKNETFLLFVSSSEYTITINGVSSICVNHDQFLNRYPYAKGVKTGTTTASGRCFVSAAEKDGLFLCGVVLNSTDIYTDSQLLMDRAFDKYMLKVVGRKDDYVASIPVSKGSEDTYKVWLQETISVPVMKDGSETAELKISLVSEIVAPVNYRQKIGILTVTVSGELVMAEDVLTTYSIRQRGWLRTMLFKQYRDILEMIG